MAKKFTLGLYAGSLTASVLLVAAMSAVPAVAMETTGKSAVQTQIFDIFRNGDPVGTHEVQKEINAETTKVRVVSNIALRFLGFTVYRFEYASEEIWDERGLRRLDVSVDNNGKKSNFDGRRDGQAFTWNAGDRSIRHLLPVYPTNHWNDGVLDQDKVLNTLTGDLDDVSITRLSREILRLPGSTVAATRYRYEGGLELDSWYDDRGRWVGMRFQGDDGSTIEYLCRDCQRGTVL